MRSQCFIFVWPCEQLKIHRGLCCFFSFGLVLQSEPILIFVVGRRCGFTCTLSHSRSNFQPTIYITCRSSMLWCIFLIQRLKILDILLQETSILYSSAILLITCRTKLKHPYSIHALMEFAKKCSRTTSFGGAELLPMRVLRIGGGPL